MDLSNPMNIWWACMVAVNVASVLVYASLCVKSAKTDGLEPENLRYKHFMRALGCIFVFVSMYRSIFPSSYPNRLAWFDTMFNSPIVIRLIATFAELSFALLVTLTVLHVNRDMPAECSFAKSKAGHFLVYKLPVMNFVCLAVAQFFAYSGLFTQNQLFFASEETLWGLGFLAVAPAALTQCRSVRKNHRSDPAYRLIRWAMTALSVFTVGYLIYQWGFALPFVQYSGLAEELAKPHLGVAEGLHNAAFHFTATHDFDTWGGMGFFIWHSGYFSICTWMNLLFAMAPRKLPKA